MRGIIGRDLSCPCCGFLRIEDKLVSGLEDLVHIFGVPKILAPTMCPDEARRWYKKNNPSSLRNIFSSVPMFEGRGLMVNWEATSALRDHCDRLGLACYELTNGTIISCR